MKKFFPYIVIIGFVIYFMWVSFTWNIPVDNQIGMFLLSCMGIKMFFIMLYVDIKNYIKSKKLKPQKF